jgi:hypothetical protein
VVVLDATDEAGLATKWATTLTAAGFNIAAAANFEPADRGSAETTVVHVRSAADQSTAESIAKKFKIDTIKVELSQDFVDPITVVLGRDLQ